MDQQSRSLYASSGKEIGGLGFKFITESDSWDDYKISKLGKMIIEKHIKKKVKNLFF